MADKWKEDRATIKYLVKEKRIMESLVETILGKWIEIENRYNNEEIKMSVLRDLVHIIDIDNNFSKLMKKHY